LNFLVTLPIGLTAAAVVRRRPLANALAVAVAVSVACEWAQVYASARFPSGTDVFNNTVGAATGVFLLKALRTPQSPRQED
jgi:glycopeptide antibiotics resistance protein